MIDAFKKLYALLDTRGRRRFALLVILMLFDALLEIAALHLVPAYVGLVAYPERVEALLPEGWQLGPHQQVVLWASMAIATFFAIKLLINTRIAASRIRFAQQTALQLSSRLLNAYLHAPYEYHLQHNSAELQRNLNNDSIQLAEQVLVPLTDLLAQGVIIAAILGVFLVYVPLGALAVLAGVLTIAGYLVLGQQHRLQQDGQAIQQLRGRLIKTTNEALACAKEISILGRQGYFIDRFRKLFAETQWHQRHIQIMAGKLIPGSVELATIMALAGMITLLFRQGLPSQQVLELVTVAAVGLARIKGSLSGFMGALSLLQHKRSILEAIHHDLTELAAPPRIESPREASSVFNRELRLRDIHYRYPGADHQVLCSLNLTIHKGEAIGFVGKTGAGKSTLIDIIIGLLKPTAGELLLDDQPLHAQLHAWQRQVGYVPQLLTLVDGSIRENVALGIPPVEIDEWALQCAIAQAQLQDLVERLPQGLDTVVGERGIRLSGGQRQRIAIARALYHDPEVIIFDEGTSALDSTTEHEVIKAVDALKRHKTILMIAHRTSTLRNCDRIFLINNGILKPAQLGAAHSTRNDAREMSQSAITRLGDGR